MRTMYQFLVYAIVLCSCSANNSTQNSNDIIYTDNVIYINDACCSKLIAIGSQSIYSDCETLQSDVFFDPTNLSDFELLQNIQPEEEITIEFALIENCETSCTIVCNRPSGIPIRVIDVYY